MQSFIQDFNTFPNAAVCERHETFNVTFQQCPLEIYQHYSLTTDLIPASIRLTCTWMQCFSILLSIELAMGNIVRTEITSYEQRLCLSPEKYQSFCMKTHHVSQL